MKRTSLCAALLLLVLGAPGGEAVGEPLVGRLGRRPPGHGDEPRSTVRGGVAAVRVAPGIGCARNPIASMILSTASTSRVVALGFITINIFLGQVGLGWFRWAETNLPY